MEPIGFALGILDQSIRLANEIMNRVKTVKENPKVCEELSILLGNIRSTLESVQNSPTDLPGSSRTFLEDGANDFKSVTAELERLREKMLASSSSSKLSWFRAFRKARKWASELEAIKNRYMSLYDRIMHLAGVEGLTRATGEVELKVDKLDRKFDELPEKWAERTVEVLGGVGDKPDTFEPSFNVPRNPEGVKLNFDDPNSLEGMLKAYLLESKSGVVAAVGVSRSSGPTAVAVGMGGVGKTCALRGIGLDQEVRQHFTGGIYWLSLGQDATDVKVTEQVAAVVKESGGKQESNDIRAMGDVSRAVLKASGWFAGSSCLFLCDDLWHTDASPEGYFYTLKDLIDEKSGSRMLCSTRDRGIARLVGSKVDFSERSAEEAKAIICGYSGFTPDDVDRCDESVQDAFRFVLGRCSGLPLALSIAGRVVADLAEYIKPRPDAWKFYRNRLRKASDELLRTRAGGHHGLFCALKASLVSASKQIGEILGEGALSIEEIYQSLCVLERQGWAPLSMLGRLWGIADEHKVAKVAQEFRRLSLVELEGQVYDGKQIVRLTLHDLAHQFCVMQAIEDGSVEKWHARVLEGYVPTRKSEKEREAGDEAREWWSADVAEDGYVHQNVARHLTESKEIRELQDLLLDFRWTVRQLEINGLLALEDDFERLKDNISSAGLRTELETECSEALGVVAGAVRLSWPLLRGEGSNINTRDLAFQMHSRLCSLRSRMVWVKYYLDSLERSVGRPRVKAVRQCHQGPGGRLRNSFCVKEIVKAVAFVGQTENVVLGCSSGKVLVVNRMTGDTVSALRGHLRLLTFVALNGDGKRLVSLSNYNRMGIWDVESGECVRELRREHAGLVSSVAISDDGQWIVSGSKDRTLRIWKVETGECLGEPLRGHTDQVNSVAISHDGRWIVSGSKDHTLRIWKLEAGECVGEPLRGHTNQVNSVAISHDGRWIVSGSSDRTLRIWDLEAGDCIGEPLQGHISQVNSVAINHDGRLIVSGASDRTLRIWKLETGECIGEPLRGHTSRVNSLAISRDGRWIVSGSRDQTLRIWKLGTGECVGEPIRGHTNCVNSLAISHDRRLIVSGSFDGTVRVWNCESGSCTAAIKSGRADVLTSAELLSIAFGGTHDSGTSVSQNAVSPVLCRNGHREIHLKKDSNGELQVLGKFDSPVHVWKFHAERKLLCAGLRDGTVGLVQILDEE